MNPNQPIKAIKIPSQSKGTHNHQYSHDGGHNAP
jgi:hypothetical protein